MVYISSAGEVNITPSISYIDVEYDGERDLNLIAVVSVEQNLPG